MIFENSENPESYLGGGGREGGSGVGRGGGVRGGGGEGGVKHLISRCILIP